MKIPAFDIDKKIAIGVSCNSNSEAELVRAIDPWINHVDYIIAVEGRYRVPYTPTMMNNTKSIPPKFGKDTESILRKHYGAKIAYCEYYLLQQEKRQKYFDVAGVLGVDALIVWDTDDLIHPDYQDFNKLLKQIALLHEFIEGKPAVCDMWAYIPSEEDYPRQYNNVPTNTWREYHRIHLNPGKQRYALNHFIFAPSESTDDQIMGFTANRENIDKKNPYLLYPMWTLDGVRITTDRKLRTQEQNDYGNNWAFQNMHEEIYRQYLLDLKVTAGMTEIYDKQYRKPWSYYFDHNGRPVMYTKEEQERFRELEL